MVWDRERYIAHSLFEDTGREMFSELFGPLHVLEKEWRLQGATESEISMKAFDWDYVPVVWLGAKAELEYRLAPHLFGGGTIFGLDHRIPNGVHIDTYRYYVNLGREMLGLEPISSEGWGRMAF